MLKLENIAVLNADKYFIKRIKPMKYEEIIFLKKHNIRNFKELEKAIYEEREVPDYFIKLYELVKSKIKELCLDEKQQIYRSKYEDYLSLDKESIIKTEEETRCSNLILENPFSNIFPTTPFKIIKELSIEELRYFLLHTSPNGENSLLSFPYIDDERLKIILRALKFYEQQIVRQANGEAKNINLFLLNYEEKRKIVEEELNVFLRYFLDIPNIKSFIWGNRINEGDKILVRIIENNIPTNKYQKRYINITETLINIFTNYMTLEELERGAIENHTLDRFILEKTL